MEIKCTAEILIETHRRFIVFSSDDAAEQKLCPACGEAMLAAEQAARFFQINARRVYKLIETGAAHFIEIETGAAMICLASLENSLQRGAAKKLGESAASEEI